MMRAVHFSSWFLLGCIASSVINWLGGIHPALSVIRWMVYFFVALLCGCLFLFDDAIRPRLKIEATDYLAIVLAIAISTTVGGLVQWIISN